MARKYPRTIERRKRKDPAPCLLCGAPTLMEAHVQVWHMRGDDEVARCCDECWKSPRHPDDHDRCALAERIIEGLEAMAESKVTRT